MQGGKKVVCGGIVLLLMFGSVFPSKDYCFAKPFAG